MKLIIDIPNYNLNDIQNGSIACGRILAAVKNGTPLLKGHGDLIDGDVAYDEFDKACLSWEGGLLKYVPTVIPADR